MHCMEYTGMVMGRIVATYNVHGEGGDGQLNVGNSTESELVSIDDVLGMLMWCKYFIEAKGYTIEDNILCQDNTSTILLVKNGIMSAGKQQQAHQEQFFSNNRQRSLRGT